MLFPVIRPESLQQKDRAADLKETIVIELERGLIDTSLEETRGLEVPMSGLEEIV